MDADISVVSVHIAEMVRLALSNLSLRSRSDFAVCRQLAVRPATLADIESGSMPVCGSNRVWINLRVVKFKRRGYLYAKLWRCKMQIASGGQG